MIHAIFKKWTIHKLTIWWPIKTSAFSLSWVTVQKVLTYTYTFRTISIPVQSPYRLCHDTQFYMQWRKNTAQSTSNSCITFLNPGVKEFLGGQSWHSQCSLFLPGYPTHTKNRAPWSSPPLDQATNQLLEDPPTCHPYALHFTLISKNCRLLHVSFKWIERTT
jgi:hypothetical protein